MYLVTLDGVTYAADFKEEAKAASLIHKGTEGAEGLSNLLVGRDIGASLSIVDQAHLPPLEQRKEGAVFGPIEMEEAACHNRLGLIGFALKLAEIAASEVDAQTSGLEGRMGCLQSLIDVPLTLDLSTDAERPIIASVARLGARLADTRHIETITRLVSTAKPPADPTFYAATAMEHMNYEMICFAAKNGYMNEATDDLMIRPWGLRAVQAASSNICDETRALEVIKLLSDNHVNVAERSRYGASPIHIAATSKLHKISSYLMDGQLIQRAEANLDAFGDDAAPSTIPSL